MLALLVLGGPLAAAYHVVSWSAPYSGWSSYTTNSLGSSGCASATNPTSPTWSTSAGAFTYAASLAATGCTSAPYTYADAYGEAIVTSAPFNGTHGGTSYVYLTWNYSVNARASVAVSATGANYSYGYASVGVEADAYLIDITGGGFVYVTTATTVLAGTSLSANGLYVLHQGWTLAYQYLTAKLSKTHTYELELFVITSAYAEAYNVVGSTSASINLAGTHGVDLTSVTIY